MLFLSGYLLNPLGFQDMKCMISYPSPSSRIQEKYNQYYDLFTDSNSLGGTEFVEDDRRIKRG